VTIFSGAGRRRRFSKAEKNELVTRAFAPGAVVAHVANLADLHSSLLYRWRRELRGGAANPNDAFAQVVVKPDDQARDERLAIRVRLGSASIDIADHAPVALVTATLRALAR
jgi:transposase